MKRKILSVVLVLVMLFSCTFTLTSCGGASIGESDWADFLNYYGTGCPDFTLFEFGEEKQAFTYVYTAPYGFLNDMDQGYRLNIYVSDTFSGDTFEDAKISAMDYYYYYDNWDNEAYKYTKTGDSWYTNDGMSMAVERVQIEYTEPCTLYPWLIAWAQYNYSAFEKTASEANTVTYTVKAEFLAELALECQKVYSDSTVTEISFVFEEYTYENIGYNDSSAYYRLDGISVKGEDGMIFAMKNIDAIITEGKFDLALKNSFELEPNFTLKGGEGVDYCELYFAENAVKIYTPNNTDESQREAYLTADYDNQTAKYIKKTAAGTWDVENISIEQFESRRQGLIDVYFGLIVTKGYGSFKVFLSDDSLLVGYGDLNGWVDGKQLTCNNIVINMEYYGRFVETMSFDYTLTLGEASITHHFELTDGGSTTVNVPSVD